uniref:Uncharacterized protein n=1 Tax=Aureoumbra lagunensis TaxID=44058 RepID=A0A7S3K2G5_9STRA
MEDHKMDEVPKKFTFSEYTREPALVQGIMDPKHGEFLVRRFTGVPGSRGNIGGFALYLKQRQKAAIMHNREEKWLMLPDSDLNKFCLAHYYKNTSAKNRMTSTEHEEQVNKRQKIVDWYTEEVAERKRLAKLVPSWNERSTPAAADRMIFRIPHDNNGRFFQDARKRYEFCCGAQGLELLASLEKQTSKTLFLLENELSALDPTKRNQLLEEGRRIYAEKPSLRKFSNADSGHNVTWSNDEYAHVGLRAQYLRLKSLQRYTETYNLCERAAAADSTAYSIFSRDQLRICSLGGGPAFELVALRDFIRNIHSARPNPPKLNMFSLDLQPAWKPYAESLGVIFRGPFDVTKATTSSLLSACDCSDSAPHDIIDILVISYLLIYCTNAHTADLLAHLLTSKKVSMLLISERTHSQDIVQLLEQRGLVVHPLMPQSRYEPDQRQLLVLTADTARSMSTTALSDNLTFHNVPFAKGT